MFPNEVISVRPLRVFAAPRPWNHPPPSQRNRNTPLPQHTALRDIRFGPATYRSIARGMALIGVLIETCKVSLTLWSALPVTGLDPYGGRGIHHPVLVRVELLFGDPSSHYCNGLIARTGMKITAILVKNMLIFLAWIISSFAQS